MSRNSTGLRSRRGTVAVVTALMLIVLIGFTAFALDLTWLVSVGTELQAGADNSALAGALRVRRSHNWAQDEPGKIQREGGESDQPVHRLSRMGRLHLQR